MGKEFYPQISPIYADWEIRFLSSLSGLVSLGGATTPPLETVGYFRSSLPGLKGERLNASQKYLKFLCARKVRDVFTSFCAVESKVRNKKHGTLARLWRPGGMGKGKGQIPSASLRGKSGKVKV
jgi:hypothetical protein